MPYLQLEFPSGLHTHGVGTWYSSSEYSWPCVWDYRCQHCLCADMWPSQKGWGFGSLTPVKWSIVQVTFGCSWAHFLYQLILFKYATLVIFRQNQLKRYRITLSSLPKILPHCRGYFQLTMRYMLQYRCYNSIQCSSHIWELGSMPLSKVYI